MYLKECYIANYGKLKDFRYEFDEKINVINQENGWGKSTFASFIKAMFYGLKQTRKTNLNENERVKYEPFDGGKFGGYIIFTHNDKTYRLERYFAKRQKDDTFSIINEDTGIKTEDFSDNIGEEIFGLDDKSYSKSAYIPQGDLAISNDDSINTKLTNLLEKEDDNDINNYEAAIKALNSKMSYYKKIGNKGRIAYLETMITDLKNQLESASSVEKTYDEYKRLQKDTILKINDLEQKIKENQNQIQVLSTYNSDKRDYDIYIKNIEKKELLVKQKKEITEFLKGRLPKLEEIKEASNNIDYINNTYGMLQENTLSKEENEKLDELSILFAGTLEEDIEAINSKSNTLLFELSNLNSIKANDNEIKTYNNLKEKYEQAYKQDLINEQIIIDNNLKISELANWENQKNNLEANLYSTKNEYEKVLLSDGNYNKKNTNMFALPLIFALVFAVLMVTSNVYYSIGFIGSILIAATFFVRNKKILLKQEMKYNDIKKEYDEQLLSIQKKIEEVNDNIKSNKNEIKCFFEKFLGLDVDKKDYNTSEYYNFLYEIKNEFFRFNELKNKIENQLTKETKEKVKELFEFIKSYIVELYKNDNAKDNRDINSLTINDETARLNSIISEEIKNISRSFSMYKNMTLKKNKYNDLKNLIENKNKELREYLNNYYDNDLNDLSDVSLSGDLKEKLENLRKKLSEFNDISNMIEELEDVILKAKNETKVDEFDKTFTSEYTLEQLQEKSKALADELTNKKNSKQKLDNELNNISETVEKIPDISGEIEAYKEELINAKNDCNLLKRTIDYLEESRNNFTHKYMNSLRDNFKEYLDELSNDYEAIEKAHIDVDFNIKFLNKGSLKEVEYLSTGYKDLINISARLALIDALFEKEKPFIIIDDPFTNLDKSKIEKAKKIIEKVANKYQVIYFICHESRMI